MKKQYMLAILLLVGFGVVYTQAFQLSNINTAAPDAYTVSTDDTDAIVNNVKLRPSKDGDRMIVKVVVTGTGGSSYILGIELEDTSSANGLYVFSGSETVSIMETSHKDHANGYIEGLFTLSGTSGSVTNTIVVNIDEADIWESVDGIFVTLADA